MRLMRWEDIAQVTEIDREAFPTMLSPNYQRELKSPLAYYIIAYDDVRTISETGAETVLKETKRSSGLISRLLFRNKATPSSRQYVAGFAGLWIMAGEAHIINIAVRQSYRRKGLGELLLISLIELAAELNSFLITLEVRASNTAAQSLYCKYGFSQTGLRRGYYSDDKEDAVVMAVGNIESALFREHLRRLKRAYSRKWGIALYQITR